jgi:hypothetical protein
VGRQQLKLSSVNRCTPPAFAVRAFAGRPCDQHPGARLAQLFEFLRRKVDVVFLRVNLECAHHARPTTEPNWAGVRTDVRGTSSSVRSRRSREAANGGPVERLRGASDLRVFRKNQPANDRMEIRERHGTRGQPEHITRSRACDVTSEGRRQDRRASHAAPECNRRRPTRARLARQLPRTSWDRVRRRQTAASP